jgi:hypothetical protein
MVAGRLADRLPARTGWGRDVDSLAERGLLVAAGQ